MLLPHPQDEPPDVVGIANLRVDLNGARDLLGEMDLVRRIVAPAAERIRNMRLRETGERFRPLVVNVERPL
jgi:hypothetical protein